MKQLFLLLLFINVVYFFWGMTVNEAQESQVRQEPLYDQKELEVLELLSKDESTQKLSEQKSMEVVPEGMEQYTCYVVGGFGSKNSASQLKDNIKKIFLHVPVVISRLEQEYWVVYPSTGDWNHSLENVKMLKIKGVTDLWLVPKGQDKGVVSLGLFKTLSRAESKLEELKKKTVNAAILNREKVSYGVKVETNDGVEAIQSFLDTQVISLENSIRKIAC
ncbi:MAG: hypothetical protein A6F70_00425 [Cycloclasticus sp. symbiont of Bathymodiolus heckerae]|nr:MAG: hypothetical protein A6F70_00425 [Cycloclasticus sp. symbiont of Bathymodiolus heckerae]